MDVFHSQFPLFRLPSNALKHTLRCFEVFGLMKLAICSEKSKILVRSLDLKAKYFQVVVKDEIFVSIQFNESQWIKMKCHANESINNNGGLPTKIEITEKTNGVTAELNNNYDMKKWMQFLMSMLHLWKINHFMVHQHAERFNSRTIYDLFKNLKIKTFLITTDVPVIFTEQLLSYFSHVTENIAAKDPFQYSGNRCTFLSQNFAAFHLHNTQNISVDELFFINSVEAYLAELDLSDKEMNVFLKHWIMGSNRRLKEITMQMLRMDVNQSVVLKGINHQIVPDQQQRKDKYYIYRHDGTKATVHFQQSAIGSFFTLSVTD